MPGLGQVPYLDVAGTFDPAGHTATLLVLNRDLENPRELRVDWREITPTKVTLSQVIIGPDLKATDTSTAQSE